MIISRTAVQVGIAAACLLVASVGIGWGTAHAQAPAAQNFPGPMVGPGPLAFGPAAVTQDENYLYVVRGSEVIKIQKRDLTTVATVNLPPMARPGLGSTRSGAWGNQNQPAPINPD
jgi:hypothetical protein